MTDDREHRTNHDRRLGEIETREADAEAPTQEVVRRGGTFESFRHRDYTLFWSGAFVSNIGTWMQNYALGLVVYAFRSSELDLGVVSFLSGIPVLFLALWAGGLADRVDRKRLIIWTQAVLLVQAAALGWLYNAGQLSSRTPIASLVWVSSLGILGGIMSALAFPSWQSMLPDLVPKDSLLNAIALNSAQFQSARLVGPLLGGALFIAGLTMGGIFYVNSVSFLFVIWALWVIRPRKQEHHAASAGETGWERIAAGRRRQSAHRAVHPRSRAKCPAGAAVRLRDGCQWPRRRDRIARRRQPAQDRRPRAHHAMEPARDGAAADRVLGVAVPCADDGDLRARGSRATHDELAGEHV